MTTASTTWYSDGLRFACRQCGACCRVSGYVWVDRKAMRRLARHLGLTLEELGRRYLRRVGRRYSLIEKPNYDCVFWDVDGCRVYEARPQQCRTFPFWREQLASPEAWAEAAAECRGMDHGRLYELAEIEDLAAGRKATDDGAAVRCGCDRE